MTSAREQALDLMRSEGINEAAVMVFAHAYDLLASGVTGLIPESTITPANDLPLMEDVDVTEDEQREALGLTAIIKLNGGLGTSMGMDRAKSLLPVRDGLSFLDITVKQVLAARERWGARLPLLFMNSFATRDDTLAALDAYPELAVDGVPLDFVQSKEPKLRADDLTPVTWEADPTLEWCPPGHGDIYPSLLASGTLDALLEAGFRYLMVSNSDNLGAAPNGVLAAWFAQTGAPFAAEVTPRTVMDRKGGHLARRASDGRLVLRESAQTPAEDMPNFTDERIHPYAHCNNLWFDIEKLRDSLVERGGVLGLPLIRNAKTVDPRDASSTPVIQVESAMGAAIEVFEGATAIVVPRTRFLPVKGTSELLLVRSDAYDLSDDYRLELRDVRQGVAPVVELTAPEYKKISSTEERFDGAPSLIRADLLRVEGDYRFASDVVVEGTVVLPATTEQKTVSGLLK